MEWMQESEPCDLLPMPLVLDIYRHGPRGIAVDLAFTRHHSRWRPRKCAVQQTAHVEQGMKARKSNCALGPVRMQLLCGELERLAARRSPEPAPTSRWCANWRANHPLD